MMRVAFALVAAAALGGCATVAAREPLVGRPIADAVRAMGPPDMVADYARGGRYFGWHLGDVRVRFNKELDNPAHWTEPMTRITAPTDLDEARLISLPDYILRPEFRPWPCSLTLIADWDARRRAWVARKAIRRGPEPGRKCGVRILAE